MKFACTKQSQSVQSQFRRVSTQKVVKTFSYIFCFSFVSVLFVFFVFITAGVIIFVAFLSNSFISIFFKFQESIAGLQSDLLVEKKCHYYDQHEWYNRSIKQSDDVRGRCRQFIFNRTGRGSK